MFPASNEAKLNYRTLEHFKTKAVNLHKNWHFSLRLDAACIKELQWWHKYLKTDIVKNLNVRQVTQTIFSDASKSGFGAIWGNEEFQGRFTKKQQELSINTKELLAIYYTLSMFANRLRGEVVLLRCDNMTALYRIRSFGSRDVLRHTIMKKIYAICKMYDIEIRISYVKSANNVSDKSSRVFKAKSVHTEWSLHDSDFQKAIKLAKRVLEVDLFASPYNKKLTKFCSWVPCDQAMHVDSFTLNLCDINGFLFAPFSCISSVLKKCVDDKIQHMCGIFPLWPMKSWWPTLMRLSQGQYSLLKGAGNRLSLPWDRSQKHPMAKKLNLIFVNMCTVSWFAGVRAPPCHNLINMHEHP